ncbi:MAG: hypothetical protein M1831_005323 [Alyxoria varia]|nr:MAG: hypothetical protein M1831_005323 [Alyxoria varia]
MHRTRRQQFSLVLCMLHLWTSLATPTQALTLYPKRQILDQDPHTSSTNEQETTDTRTADDPSRDDAGEPWANDETVSDIQFPDQEDSSSGEFHVRRVALGSPNELESSWLRDLVRELLGPEWADGSGYGEGQSDVHGVCAIGERRNEYFAEPIVRADLNPFTYELPPTNARFSHVLVHILISSGTPKASVWTIFNRFLAYDAPTAVEPEAGGANLEQPWANDEPMTGENWSGEHWYLVRWYEFSVGGSTKGMSLQNSIQIEGVRRVGRDHGDMQDVEDVIPQTSGTQEMGDVPPQTSGTQNTGTQTVGSASGPAASDEKMHVASEVVLLVPLLSGLVILFKSTICHGENIILKRQGPSGDIEDGRENPIITMEPWPGQRQIKGRPPRHPGLQQQQRGRRRQGLSPHIQQEDVIEIEPVIPSPDQRGGEAQQAGPQRTQEDVSEREPVVPSQEQHGHDQQGRSPRTQEDVSGIELVISPPVQRLRKLQERVRRTRQEILMPDLPIQAFKKHADILNIHTYAVGTQWNAIDHIWVDDLAHCVFGSYEHVPTGEYVADLQKLKELTVTDDSDYEETTHASLDDSNHDWAEVRITLKVTHGVSVNSIRALFDDLLRYDPFRWTHVPAPRGGRREQVAWRGEPTYAAGWSEISSDPKDRGKVVTASFELHALARKRRIDSSTGEGISPVQDSPGPSIGSRLWQRYACQAASLGRKLKQGLKKPSSEAPSFFHGGLLT